MDRLRVNLTCTEAIASFRTFRVSFIFVPEKLPPLDHSGAGLGGPGNAFWASAALERKSLPPVAVFPFSCFQAV